MTSRREITVDLANGLHMVPCSRIVELVRHHDGHVQIHHNERTVDAKSMLELMTLNAPRGTVLVVEVSGQDAESLLDGLQQLIATEAEH